MRTPLASSCSLAVLAFAAAAFAADSTKIPSPWDGFGVGTWVTMKTTTQREMAIPGVPSMPAQTSERRQTLVKVTDEAYVVRHDTKAGDQWVNGAEISYPRVAKALPGAPADVKPEEIGKEKLTVDGTEIECRKMRTLALGQTMVMWVSDSAGVLKTETSMPNGGTTRMTVTSLSKKATVAGKDLACREEVTTTEAPEMSVKSTRIQNATVPGGLVRSESVMRAKQMTMTTVEEVTAYEVK